MEKTGQKCEYEDREEERSDPGEAIVGGNQKLTRGRFVVEFFCLVPILVGPFLDQLGFVGVQEGFFSEEGPKIRWCGSSILCGGRHKLQPRQ